MRGGWRWVHALATAGALAFACGAQATTRNWPGTAPCAGTLQACLAASALGDTVVIVTETPIDEQFNVEHAVNLVAGPGLRPRFAAGRIVVFTPQDPGPWSLLVSGITLDDGYLAVQVLAAGNVVLDDIVGTSTDGFAPVSVSFFSPASGSYAGSVEIRGCRVRVGGSSGFGIRAVSFPGVAMTVRIADNRVEPIGVNPVPPPPTAGPFGIGVQAQAQQPANIEIVRNTLGPALGSLDPAARLASGIVVGTGPDAGPVAVRVADNAVVLRASQSLYNAGVSVAMEGGAVDARILNNTVIGGHTGVRIERFGPAATLGGRLDNNLLAYLNRGVVIGSGLTGDFGNDYNALYAIANGSDFVPGPHTVTLDPEIAAPTRPRLTAASPLRNVGSADLRAVPGPGTLAPLPDLDADGLRRLKLGVLDIGAYEYGDQTLTWNTVGFNPVTTIDDPRINGDFGAILQVARSGGGNPSDTTPNPRPMTQRYNNGSGRWELLADDGFNLNVGVGFQVFAPASGAGRGLHTTAAANIVGNVFTVLDPAFGALPPDTILLVTPTRGVGGTGVPNPHPVAPTYQFGSWYLWNLDNAAMPIGTRFALYAQAPSANAYVHQAAAFNLTSGGATLLSHPRLNGNRCAAPHVGPSANGALNAHPIGVRYDAALQRWYVRNEDGTAVPPGTSFFVVIDPAAGEAACAENIFLSGFEDAL